jgi:hypothetical protein
VRQRQSKMWRPGLHPTRSNDAVCASLRHSLEQRYHNRDVTQATSCVLPFGADGGEIFDTQAGAQENISTPRSEPAQLAETPNIVLYLPITELNRDSKQFSKRDSHKAGDVIQSASPASDTTLCDESTTYTDDHVNEGKGAQADAPFDGLCALTPAPRRRVRHERNISTDSAYSAIRTPTIPLRARAKTNDGMLQLKASSTRDHSSTITMRSRHRRKVSLNIPIKPSHTQLQNLQHPNLSGWTASYRAPEADNEASVILTPEERELEYKHRHTFIGTASLDDFLETLELSDEHTTTKAAVIRSFITLSSSEQLHARQCSAEPHGWELVSRITSEVTSTDYVAQLQVKLGSITLRQFLDLVPFDEKGDVGALLVVKAFSAASHMDSRAGVGTGSKARAFRSWMITNEYGV